MSPSLKRKRYSQDVGIMDLPSELKEQIISSIPPAERRPLRLVNKTMLNAVEMSMRDVVEIAVSFMDEGGCRVLMTTVNPYNGTTAAYDYKIDPLSLSFLLPWAGICTESLSVTTANCFKCDRSRLYTVRRVLKALNEKDACPKLMRLSVTSCRLYSDEVLTLIEVLLYVTKRQLQSKAVADRPPPFLHSLSLTISSNCPSDSEYRMFTSIMSRIGGSERKRILVIATADRAALLESFGREPLIQPLEQSNLLQQILDQCHGLKELNVDSLLMAKSIPVMALHYPTTLTHLKTTRLGKTPGELRIVAENCPHLQIVEDLSSGFMHDDADIRALVSLSDLRALSIASAATGDAMVRLTDLSLAAFGERPYGPHIVRPWTQITSIALNYVSSDFLKLLSRGCPTLQEVRIEVLANTPSVTEETIGYLIDLPNLRVLIVEDKNDERPVLVGDSLLDAIANKCHRLEQVCLFPCSVALQSLPRLLRECSRLRSIALRSLSIALETFDSLDMVRRLAQDLCDRKVAVVVQVKEIMNADCAAVKRITNGLEAGTVMAMSSVMDSCAPGLKVTANGCFNSPEARANAHRLEEGGWDSRSRSFILVQRRRPNAAIIFEASGQ